jgi:hypothetical protein
MGFNCQPAGDVRASGDGLDHVRHAGPNQAVNFAAPVVGGDEHHVEVVGNDDPTIVSWAVIEAIVGGVGGI